MRSLDANMETGLDVSAERTKDVSVFRGRNKKQIDNLKIDNKLFKYLGTSVTNCNCIKKDIKSKLILCNACCRLIQTTLSSAWLSKNRNNRNMRIYNFACCCTWVCSFFSRTERNISCECWRIGADEDIRT
jgi:hypothetical protein